MMFLRRIIKLIDSIIDFTVLSILLLLLFYGCYALWDSQQLYASADKSHYEVYKPSDEDNTSFEELLAINPEVFGWLSVYGTNIDYPLTQGKDNEKYVNTAANGEYSLSGSLFLDYRNQNDFSDYNSIIFGHHMEKQKMFGELSHFDDITFFNEHRYGMIYYGGKEYGIEFFAFLEIDAYDQLYRPAITGVENQKSYLKRIQEKAINYRELTPIKEPHLVLLSTCTSDITNGRHILVGRISDKVEKDIYYQAPQEKHIKGIDGKENLWEIIQGLPVWILVILIITILILIIALIVSVYHKFKGNCK